MFNIYTMFKKDWKLTFIFLMIICFICRIIYLLSNYLLDITLIIIICIYIFNKYKQFHKKLERFEGDYLIFPKNITFIELNNSINRILDFFGMETFELIVGTALRGDKSGNYRDEQYAKKIISEDIMNELNNLNNKTNEEKLNIKYNFLYTVNYKNMLINNNKVKFILHIKNKYIEDILKTINKYNFNSLSDERLEGEFILPVNFYHQVFYGIFFENEGVRITNDEFHYEAYTKCPIISYEYSMIYYLHITCKYMLEQNPEFKKNLFTSLYKFYNFILEIFKNKNNMPILKKILRNDLNTLNENSVNLYLEFEKYLININNKTINKDFNIEATTNLIIKIGNKLQEIIMHFNTSDNVFKHFNVPLFIQRTIIDFNYFHEKNQLDYKVPSLKFNFPYISNNFWGILDPHELHQNLQIALDKFHLLNIWIVDSEEKANEISNFMLNILKKHISKKQFNYLSKNYQIKKYTY